MARLDLNGTREGIVEDGVRNQTARVIRFPVRAVRGQRVAISTLNRAGGNRMAQQLICIQRLDVSTMVLVEVRKTVVEQHRRVEVCLNIESKIASHRRGLSSPGIFGGGILTSPLRWDDAAVGGFERTRYQVGGHVFEAGYRVAERCFGFAVCVVDHNLLYLMKDREVSIASILSLPI